jgi:ribosomal protein L37E
MPGHTEKCAECGTRYNAMANNDCPYCEFPDFQRTNSSD